MPSAVVIPYWFDRPALEAVDIACNADRQGFDELWIGEMATFDAFALAGTIVRETARITPVLGPLAVGVRTPVGLAMGLSSVATLANRPAHLALGASNPPIVSGWHGRDWRRPVARMRETVTVLRQLFAGERAAYDGETVSANGFHLVLDAPDVTIGIAAFGPQMLRLATRLGDRVVVNLLTVNLVRRTREQMETIAAKAGCACPPLVAWVPAALEPGPATHRLLANQLSAYVGAPGYGEMFADAGFGRLVERARSGGSRRDVADAIPRELLQSVCAMGSAENVRARIDAFQAAGADTVALVPATADDPGGRRLLSAFAPATVEAGT